MNSIQDITNKVAKLASDCGRYIAKEAQHFSLEHVEFKGKSDLVSYVDKQTEEKLVHGLNKILPEAGFITEEDTEDETGKEFTWIIDPLDGTTNFVHSLPTYAVSVALMQGDEIISGVVHEVNRDESFYAWKDGGAYLNGRRIQVTNASKIDDCLFATGFPIHNFEKLDQYLAILNGLMKNSHGLRRVGSAATDLAYVACGRYEGFFEYNLKPWDVAAGIRIILEAGGHVSDFKGGNDYLFGREIVAAGPVHPELLRVIKQYWFDA